MINNKKKYYVCNSHYNISKIIYQINSTKIIKFFDLSYKYDDYINYLLLVLKRPEIEKFINELNEDILSIYDKINILNILKEMDE